MPRRSNDGRLKLGDPLATELADFCAANYGAPEIEIIREALREHLARRLGEPEMRKRVEEARKRRLEGAGKPIKLVRPESA
jgi:hypothetical protein